MMAVLRCGLASGFYLFAGLVAIYLLSGHPYEWMIGESSLGEPPVTYCTLPAPSDSTFDVGIFASAFFVLAGVGMGLFWRKRDTGRAVLVCAGLLAAVAIYRFFLRSMFC
jgi:hypothetical protein